MDFHQVGLVCSNMNTKKYDRIAPVLYELHWLPVFYRIYFKKKLLILRPYMACHLAIYISDLDSVRSCSAYSLRWNYTIVLERPVGCMLATLGTRSFYAGAPTLWNSLPAHIREIESLGAFKRHVKTHLFRLAFT